MWFDIGLRFLYFVRDGMTENANTQGSNPNKLTWLPQEKTSTEYGQALAHLSAFVERDVSGITAAEVAELATLLCVDLQTVVTSQGVLEYNGMKKQSEYVLGRDVGEGRVVVTADAFYISISKVDDRNAQVWHDGQTFHLTPGFGITLPVNDVFMPKEVATSLVNRRGNITYLTPLTQPQNAEGQQTFATLLQEGIRDIVPSLPLPTPPPNF